MEKTIAPVSKQARIAGWIVSGLLILFLLFDAITKIMMESHSVQGSTALGWPASAIPGIGVVLFISTLLYLIRKTAVIGAILLTGYLGGAMAIMIRAGQPMYFTTVFILLVWVGVGLRDARVKPFLL